MQPNIRMVRIDNRLVHGQVGVTWTSSLGVNLLVVVDDEAATNPVQQQLMTMTADNAGVGIRFFSIDTTLARIHQASASQNIFIVAKTPDVVRRLVEGGVPIKAVNVGNMHFSEGKRPLSKKVYVDNRDLEDLKAIQAHGIDVFLQDTPDDVKRSVD